MQHAEKIIVTKNIKTDTVLSQSI